ncbi:hypothetical protein EN836_33580, partial [Mesorhizobium sp. M1C.F.Ca.ET.193.01.1.1]
MSKTEQGRPEAAKASPQPADILPDHELLGLMFDQAPGFITLLSEPGHVFQLTNAAFQHLISQRQVTGKPVREAL